MVSEHMQCRNYFVHAHDTILDINSPPHICSFCVKLFHRGYSGPDAHGEQGRQPLASIDLKILPLASYLASSL